MAKLILSFESTVLKTFPLDKDRITIGRRPDNDIQVDNLAVSGLHAVVTTIQNDSVVEDQHSTNGTMVNGQLVQKHLLQHNDVIELGKHKLRFMTETATAANYQNFAKTMVMRRPDVAGASAIPAARDIPTVAPDVPLVPVASMPVPASEPAMAAPAALAAAPLQPAREAALKVLSGSAAGRVLDLNKNLTTIGKAGVQVVVFTRRPVGYFVSHVEGDVAPLINGEPLGQQPRQLNDQDTIDIAGTKMSFFYKS
jgi:pSer/pThr/pTyr-binding forkhead associated (FHA) protein